MCSQAKEVGGDDETPTLSGSFTERYSRINFSAIGEGQTGRGVARE
jgi:hypothetical protein